MLNLYFVKIKSCLTEENLCKSWHVTDTPARLASDNHARERGVAERHPITANSHFHVAIVIQEMENAPHSQWLLFRLKYNFGKSDHGEHRVIWPSDNTQIKASL